MHRWAGPLATTLETATKDRRRRRNRKCWKICLDFLANPVINFSPWVGYPAHPSFPWQKELEAPNSEQANNEGRRPQKRKYADVDAELWFVFVDWPLGSLFRGRHWGNGILAPRLPVTNYTLRTTSWDARKKHKAPQGTATWPGAEESWPHTSSTSQIIKLFGQKCWRSLAMACKFSVRFEKCAKSEKGSQQSGPQEKEYKTARPDRKNFCTFYLTHIDKDFWQSSHDLQVLHKMPHQDERFVQTWAKMRWPLGIVCIFSWPFFLCIWIPMTESSGQVSAEGLWDCEQVLAWD